MHPSAAFRLPRGSKTVSYTHLEIRRRAINANLKLIECPIRHLGTEEGYKIYSRLEDHLKEIGVEMKFNTMVNDITIKDGRATAVTLEDGTVYEADEIVSAVGREGADWFSDVYKRQLVSSLHQMGDEVMIICVADHTA